MVKAFAASGFAVTLLFTGGLAAIACSSNSDSTFAPEPPKPDAEDGPISSLIPDGGPAEASAEAGPASCTAAIPAAFTPAWTAPTKKAACSPADVKAYYAACVAKVSVTEADGTCTRWKAANAACGACAEPDDQTGPIQWHLKRTYQTLNTAGCIALSNYGAGAGKCGESYNAAVLCTRQSCEGCFAIGGTFDQFRECQKSVQGVGICKSYETAQGSDCLGYKDTASPALDCFNNGSETQEVHFSRVVTLFCGM